ncbi:MAG: helix-turn-helix transcriptional regulator [Spirochaetaceae bacterium]|nr:helix-turn-helix transcriptional regulator [Spirochaetaceae bacterium]
MNRKNISFKERLTDELNYQGISNKDFANKVGISSNTLNMYLYRGSMPSADIAVKMAQVLNTTTEYLVAGTDDEKPLPKNDTKSDWQKKEINMIVNMLSPNQLEHFLEIARAYKQAVESPKA